MTTQQIKEQVDKHLLFMVASQMSCKISELYLDNGVDFMLVGQTHQNNLTGNSLFSHLKNNFTTTKKQ